MGFLVKMILVVIVGALFFGYSPIFLDFQPQPYKIIAFEKLTGALEVNTRLGDGERLFEGKIFGPESLAAHEESIYTGTMDGCITKVTGNSVTCVAQNNKNCESTLTGKGLGDRCSRPLGLRFDKTGKLYVADAYKGVYTVDVKTGVVRPILGTNVKIGEKEMAFPDDLDIDDKGIIYLSDASTKWSVENVALLVLEHENTGRIIKYDQKTKKASILLDNLYFPNGIQLSKSGDSLLIAEFSKNRILKYYLKGSKIGQHEVFADLPGSPDNIRPSKNGYWIALLRYHNPSDPGLMNRLSRYPVIKKIIVRFQHAVGSALLYLHQYWKSPELLDFSNQLRECRTWIVPSHFHGMAVEVDENGKIIQSIQSPDGKHGFISEILEKDGYLYAGSFINPYLIKIKQK